jgi:D-tyrosyl-tRNA(Tyr) deacylase
MKVLIQRVKKAQVSTADIKGKIEEGLLAFVGVEEADNLEDISFLAEKTVNLRIFEDEQGKMNLSVKDKGFEIMSIPNFTLASSLKKGRRPSFDLAASKEKGKEFFDIFCKKIEEEKIKCIKGVFGASMLIDAKNYGPVNIILDSQIRHTSRH